MIIIGFLVALVSFLAIDMLINFRNRTNTTVDNHVLNDQTLAYHLDWDSVRNQKFLKYLYVKKINAIIRYQDLAGVSHTQAEEAIEYVLAHPELLPTIPQKRRPPLPDAENDYLQALLSSGKTDKAITHYANLVDVDQFTAQQVIERMARDLYVTTIHDADVAQSLTQDDEARAIQLLQTRYGLTENEAIHAIDAMQTDAEYLG
ncbi:MAG: hypothetical protein AAF846_06970 [Chloroflexota bacterium]